jgi:aspartate/methionine/tyrosine aminotransferase
VSSPYDREFFGRYLGYFPGEINPHASHDFAEAIARHEQPFINLGGGEMYTPVTPELPQLYAAAAAEAVSQGYLANPYGLLEYRKQAMAFIAHDEGVSFSPDDADGISLYSSTCGSRLEMTHVAAFVRAAVQDPAPLALTPSPGWDYHGPLESEGFRVSSYYLDPDAQWRTSGQAILDRIDRIHARGPERVRLVVVNPQHNPTATNIDEDQLAILLAGLFERGVYCLVDNAYFGIHDPGTPCSSAWRVAARLGARDGRDYARYLFSVRSFGKLLSINGWATGVLIAKSRHVWELATRIRMKRLFAQHAAPQLALSRFLSRREHVVGLIGRHNEIYRDKREAFAATLRRVLGLPADQVWQGSCTRYLLSKVPPAYRERETSYPFISEVLDRCNVSIFSVSSFFTTADGERRALTPDERRALFRRRDPWATEDEIDLCLKNGQWMRFFLGATVEQFDEFATRAARLLG